MASIAGSAAAQISARPRLAGQTQVINRFSGLKILSSSRGKSFPAVRLQSNPSRMRVSCATKPETLNKVIEIVRKQLAIPAGSTVTGDSKFSDLGADSLDTVEIVMGLEENFDISVEEDSAQSIVTVGDAAALIDKLVDAKA